MTEQCWICDGAKGPLDPDIHVTWREVRGWHRPGNAGGSDVVLREDGPRRAHPGCIDEWRRARARGVGNDQNTLFGEEWQ